MRQMTAPRDKRLTPRLHLKWTISVMEPNTVSARLTTCAIISNAKLVKSTNEASCGTFAWVAPSEPTTKKKLGSEIEMN